MSKRCSSKKSIKDKENQQPTSWEPIARDYHQIVHLDGHYYHQKVILPQLLPLLSLHSESSVLDIGCGQGILERMIPKGCRYLGMDLSPSLVAIATKLRKSKKHHFLVQDLTQPLPQNSNFSLFSCAVAILSLQNMEEPDKAIQNTAQLLQYQGRFFLVLNHPCFRIPRCSSWHYDESKKLLSRKMDRYLSPMKIPIFAHPGKKQSKVSLSFHFPLSYWVHALSASGFVIENMEEWISPKKSLGSRAKAENLCRKEFPLFLMISCIKINR